MHPSVQSSTIYNRPAMETPQRASTAAWVKLWYVHVGHYSSLREHGMPAICSSRDAASDDQAACSKAESQTPHGVTYVGNLTHDPSEQSHKQGQTHRQKQTVAAEEEGWEGLGVCG